MAEQAVCCPKCKKPFSFRVPRGSVVKSFLFFLPLRRYFCNSCFKKKYVWYSGSERYARHQQRAHQPA